MIRFELVGVAGSNGMPSQVMVSDIGRERSISGLGLHLLDAKVGLFYSARWIELRLGFFATF